MAKNGFMPAWMKITSSNKTNGNQKFNLNHQLANETNPIIITTGQCRNQCNEQQLSNDVFDEQSEKKFSFKSRGSYNQERLSNSFAKNSELNNNNFNHSSINSNINHQHRLHSISSSYINNRLTSNNHHNLINENNCDQREKDFPSFNRRKLSSNNNEQSLIWNNAASKFHILNNDENLSHRYDLNRLITRKDRLLNNTTNNLNNNQSIIFELQTNCITQTKNLDKRSEFLNSLKNNSIIEEKNINENNYKTTKETLSESETLEEKELLIRMGWNDNDINYEITDKDKEEYEKKLKLLPKIDNRPAALMTALHRHSLPCINIQDVLRLEMINSTSDDDSSDD